MPVSHEEVRIEREPITEANRDAALAGGDLTEEEHEVILHAERPVVDKETVPVERVKLATETVTEEQQVTEQVRKEQIEQVTDARPPRHHPLNPAHHRDVGGGARPPPARHRRPPDPPQHPSSTHRSP